MPLSPARCSGTMPQPSLGPLPSHTHNSTKLTRFLSYTQADLSGIFNWNVKQLFVYISATYATQSNTFNEVVIWDKVITGVEHARLRLNEQYNKYPLVDQRTELRGMPISLSISWDIMPITGMLLRRNRTAARFLLPTQYCADNDCVVSPLATEDAATAATVDGGRAAREL